MTEAVAPHPAVNHFIRQIILTDRAAGKHGGRVATRFPPEPNGYLHLGHAKSICLNFGLAREFGGSCDLRFDDTNPAKEDIEYVEAIKNDVRWLGFDWDTLRHTSDYFEVLYLCAEKLIRDGNAFVCDLSADEVREYRGTLTEPGPQLAVPRAQRRGKPRPVPPHARRRVPRRRAHAAREDRHGVRQHQHARSDDLPHPQDDAPEHRRHLADLSDVRLRALRVGRGRGHHAFAVHARVRGSPAAVRLVPRPARPARPRRAGRADAPRRSRRHAEPPAADRIRARQSRLHGHEQAQADGAGAGTPRRRLGRPAHADARRRAPPRLSAGGDPHVLGTRRRHQAELGDRIQRARSLRARGSRRRAPRRMAVLDPIKLVIDQSRRGARGIASSSPNHPKNPSSARAVSRSRARCGSSATISPKCRRKDSIDSCPAAKCACAASASCVARK